MFSMNEFCLETFFLIFLAPLEGEGGQIWSVVQRTRASWWLFRQIIMMVATNCQRLLWMRGRTSSPVNPCRRQSLAPLQPLIKASMTIACSCYPTVLSGNNQLVALSVCWFKRLSLFIGVRGNRQQPISRASKCDDWHMRDILNKIKVAANDCRDFG